MKLDQDLDNISDKALLTFIDLDNLKFYNDEYGHARGDQLLKGFASQLQNFQTKDLFVYRIGGDEFAILNHKGVLTEIEQLLETSIENLIKQDFAFTGASFGSALRNEVENISALKHLADMRMYENKQQRTKLNTQKKVSQ